MWPRWLCIFLCTQFTETYEKSQQRKVKKMQPVWQCMFLGMRFERNIQKHTVEKNETNATRGWKCLLQLNATSVIMNLRNAIWRLFWKYTVEKSQIKCDYASYRGHSEAWRANNEQLHNMPLFNFLWISLWIAEINCNIFPHIEIFSIVSNPHHRPHPKKRRQILGG